VDRIQRLQVFLRIAETGSFTKAAQALNLPRATVSAALQQLEAGLGARLLHRTTRRVQLTADGEALLARCRPLLADMEEVENLFRQTPERLAGSLRVDVPSRIGRRLIAPALPEFFQRYPDIELELGATDRPVDLLLERVDCVLRVGPVGHSSLICRPLAELELINCASPSYLKTHGQPRTVQDLHQHWAVNYASPASGAVDSWEYPEGGEYHQLAMRSRVTVNNAETYIACALAGLGLIQVPAFDVRELLEAGELQEVLPDARAAPMPAQLLYPHPRQLSPRVQVFAQWLESLLRRQLQDQPPAVN
jgi:DNA-binding transcriptional LysR family regulator